MRAALIQEDGKPNFIKQSSNFSSSKVLKLFWESPVFEHVKLRVKSAYRQQLKQKDI